MAENELDFAETESAPAGRKARKAPMKAKRAQAASGAEATVDRRRAPRRGAATASRRASGAAAENVDREPPKSARGRARVSAKGSSQPVNLREDLRDFASGRPSGWGHEDWLNFLEALQSRGHNINDRDAIGMALEKERLDIALERIKGVGPQRRKALLERYGNVWELRNADPSEVANAGGLDRALAERVQAQLQ